MWKDELPTESGDYFTRERTTGDVVIRWFNMPLDDPEYWTFFLKHRQIGPRVLSAAETERYHELVREKASAVDRASKWYTTEEVVDAIQVSGGRDAWAWPEIPSDTRSPEFAVWLTGHLQRAMAKGIQLARAEKESESSTPT